MAKRKVPPSRTRYEAAHPTLTVRIPVAVKTTIQQAAAANGLSVSEWLQAQVAGHVTKTAQAYQQGVQHGQQSGVYAGWLMAMWAQEKGLSFNPPAIRGQ